jgi:acyl-CoA synthetase (AMP-forming)/AMP-acid ligase II
MFRTADNHIYLYESTGTDRCKQQDRGQIAAQHGGQPIAEAMFISKVGRWVHAVVVTKSSAQISAEEWIEFCKTLIASYKWPRRVEVCKSPLPLSGTG